MAHTVPDPHPDVPAYHLVVAPAERPVLELALRLYHDDMAPAHDIRRSSWRLLEQVRATAGEAPATLALDEIGLKIAYHALHTLLDDTQRGQAAARREVWALLEKLPDEHAIRAIRFP